MTKAINEPTEEITLNEMESLVFVLSLKNIRQNVGAAKPSNANFLIQDNLIRLLSYTVTNCVKVTKSFSIATKSIPWRVFTYKQPR